jgi:hypothetical protein
MMQVVVTIEAACRARSAEAVRSSTLKALAMMEPFRGTTPGQLHLSSAWRADLSCEAHASLWLIDASTHSILALLDADDGQDWDQLGATSAFAESGVEQLQERLASGDQ